MMLEGDLHVDETEEKKPRRRKKLMMPPKEIVPIRCADKRGVEQWTPERAKNLANFPSPARILLIGSCGVGKSTMIKNLIIHARPRFQECYLIHEDCHATKEYDDLEPTEKFDDVPPLEFWDQPGKYKKRCVIVDDLELTSAHKERKKNLAIMFRYASTHKGLTIYFAHQSFFDILGLIKKMSDVVILWKPKARYELSLIENQCGLEEGTLKQLFKTIATGHRDSICLDLKENSPAKIRLNLWQPIELVEQEDNES